MGEAGRLNCTRTPCRCPSARLSKRHAAHVGLSHAAPAAELASSGWAVLQAAWGGLEPSGWVRTSRSSGQFAVQCWDRRRWLPL